MLTQNLNADTNFAIRLPGFSLPIELRRSSRAKRLTLKVSHTERTAILTLPDRGRMEDATAFLTRHHDWLKAQAEKIPSPVTISDGAIIPLRGVPHRLKFAGRTKQMGVVWTEDDGEIPLTLSAEDCEALTRGTPDKTLFPFGAYFDCDDVGRSTARLCIAGEPVHAPRRLIDWLRLEAKKDLFYRVHHHANNLGIYPKRITVRDQSTRWGSCSSTGNLSFSWRLIFAPSYVLDYVAAHEVAHLKEMNHGPRFWRLVRQTYPEMQKAKIWLKKHGSELHRFNTAAPPNTNAAA